MPAAFNAGGVNDTPRAGSSHHVNAIPESPTDRLRRLLRGFPDITLLACERFQTAGNPADFELAVCGVIQQFLDKPPATDVAAMPGSTRLVEDLGLDSLTMVEMVFLFEDVFTTSVPHERLVKVTTLDELKTLLRSCLPARAPNPP